GVLARDLPETALHATSPHPTTRSPAAPFTCSVAWVSEAVRGDVNPPHINGREGVRGSNPLSSTPGPRPNSASAVPGSPAPGSRSAATRRRAGRSLAPPERHTGGDGLALFA